METFSLLGPSYLKEKWPFSRRFVNLVKIKFQISIKNMGESWQNTLIDLKQEEMKKKKKTRHVSKYITLIDSLYSDRCLTTIS